MLIFKILHRNVWELLTSAFTCTFPHTANIKSSNKPNGRQLTRTALSFFTWLAELEGPGPWREYRSIHSRCLELDLRRGLRLFRAVFSWGGKSFQRTGTLYIFIEVSLLFYWLLMLRKSMDIHCCWWDGWMCWQVWSWSWVRRWKFIGMWWSCKWGGMIQNCIGCNGIRLLT